MKAACTLLLPTRNPKGLAEGFKGTKKFSRSALRPGSLNAGI